MLDDPNAATTPDADVSSQSLYGSAMDASSNVASVLHQKDKGRKIELSSLTSPQHNNTQYSTQESPSTYHDPITGPVITYRPGTEAWESCVSSGMGESGQGESLPVLHSIILKEPRHKRHSISPQFCDILEILGEFRVRIVHSNVLKSGQNPQQSVDA